MQTSGAGRYFDSFMRRFAGTDNADDTLRALWLSCTLFFTVGGYWLLRSIKDPIMAAIDGVEYIPQAKMASLVVVFLLVFVYNNLLDYYPKVTLFYCLGALYGCLFFIIGLLLMHPTIGLPNTAADPTRILGWLSYCAIESFGSLVVTNFWALVNASVDVNFSKKYYGYIVAGANIGAIMGPALATQAETVGVPFLYLTSAFVMFAMISAFYVYTQRFGGVKGEENGEVASGSDSGEGAKPKKEKTGMSAAFVLFYDHHFVKGLFAVSSLYMVQVTIVDFILKVMARARYQDMYPDDPQHAISAFASFMGVFGILTNSITFMFALLGTGKIIQKYGVKYSLISFPCILAACAVVVYVSPNIWTVLAMMMIMKAMGYALNNPAKEILYQVTSHDIMFKCKSVIDTFGQRSSKAMGSIVTNAVSDSLVDLVNYGTIVGLGMSGFLVWVAIFMGKTFEEMQATGRKVGSDEEVAPEPQYSDVGEEGEEEEDIESEKSKSYLLSHRGAGEDGKADI